MRCEGVDATESGLREKGRQAEETERKIARPTELKSLPLFQNLQKMSGQHRRAYGAFTAAGAKRHQHQQQRPAPGNQGQIGSTYFSTPFARKHVLRIHRTIQIIVHGCV